jgi:phage gp29-like protein
MEIEFVADREKRAGAELYERRLDWLNREVSKLVLGSTAATEALAGGHAVGKEHRDVEIDVKRYDAQTLATTINRQIIAPMIAFTFGPQARYPLLAIGQPDQVPLQEFYPGVAAMIDRGLKVRAREVRERFGLSDPEPGDQVMGPATDIGAGQKPLRALPEEEGDMQSAFAPLRRLLMAAESGAGEVMEALGARLAEEAEGALAGLTGRVRRAFERARDLPDLAARLEALALPKAEFGTAMAKGLALAHLAGRAEVLEELGRGAPRA